ncbi:hypothetical protein BSGG_5365 [Bacteroides sp. D2]|jgi:hypothetical protein|nr:hypothetical protein BSGG_5365 [Bacteroides sp. D2]
MKILRFNQFDFLKGIGISTTDQNYTYSSIDSDNNLS